MIIFGLGNPGLRYRFTRHNAGYLFVECLAKHHAKKFLRRKRYSISHIRIESVDIRLIKPRCWMNQCGDAIKGILNECKTDFMVVVDDINLPVGRIRLRSKGSDGGHRGLRSAIKVLQTENFLRLRIGVGRPSIDAADYVLRRFTREERSVLLKAIREANGGIHVMFRQDFAKAQNHINSIDIKDAD